MYATKRSIRHEINFMLAEYHRTFDYDKYNKFDKNWYVKLYKLTEIMKQLENIQDDDKLVKIIINNKEVLQWNQL